MSYSKKYKSLKHAKNVARAECRFVHAEIKGRRYIVCCCGDHLHVPEKKDA